MNRLLNFIVILICMFSASSTYAGIYKWTDDKGNVYFSDRKPAHLKAKEVEVKINTYTSVSYDKSLFNTGKKVIMYSTSRCTYCRKAKAYFRSKGIDYVEHDIEKSPKARAEYDRMGATGVPVILVGNKRMNGFSEKGFEKIYN